ncbi:MAG: YqeG family HAD IIIA-type phosphatase [Pirellulales bacterium]|nr:YqeG family HAD IIIA-type phosphatase [Pirellulales bacterium]
MFRWILPDLRVASVLELSPERLAEFGLTALLLDVDCTLKAYRSPSISDEVAAWLARLRQAGIALCLVSNGRGPRIRRLAKSLDLPHVAQSLKPLPRGCRRAIRKLALDPTHTAMVGDQLFADVVAGRLAGLFTILVEPIHPEQEPWFTRLKRPLERRLLKTR